MMRAPCYDPETKTDCPKRTAGCQISCKRWAKYVKERDEYYAQKNKETLERIRYEDSRRRSRVRVRNGNYHKRLQND
jgi:hypothetical protein